MKVTVQQIADRCGIGRSTTSFILANKSSQVGISQKLTDKVLAVAKEMGYKSNALAYAVKTGRSKTIAYITPALNASHTMRLISGVVDYCNLYEYNLKLISLKTSNKTISQIVDYLISNMVAGIVIDVRDDIELWEKYLAKTDIKIVIAFYYDANTTLNQIFSDDFNGGRLAVETFFECGHKKIGFACGEETVNRGYSAVRKAGYLQGIDDFNLEVNENDFLLLSENFVHNEIDMKAVKEFMENPERPTSIFCATDPIALLFMQYAQTLGYNIPEDISVMGFANLHYANLSFPALSTIDQPFEEIGKKAAEILICDIEQGYHGEKITNIDVSYVERMSIKKMN